VRVDELTNILSLVWAFFHDLAIVFEQMVYEEFVEFL